MGEPPRDADDSRFPTTQGAVGTRDSGTDGLDADDGPQFGTPASGESDEFRPDLPADERAAAGESDEFRPDPSAERDGGPIETNNGQTTDRDAAAAVGSTPPPATCRPRLGLGPGVGVKADGALWTWNVMGAVADGLGAERRQPELLDAQRSWCSVGSGGACAITATGELYCWGENWAGRLGDDDAEDRPSPEPTGAEHRWLSVSGKGDEHCAVRVDGTLHCWGRRGLFGDPGTTGNPITQIGADTDWLSVHLAGHACALKRDGRLYCWGDNYSGQLGDGSFERRSEPSPVASTLCWTAVGVGASNTCAVADDGSLWCWGTGGSYCPLARPLTLDAPVPVRIGLRNDWVATAVGDGTPCAVDQAGQVHCWGDNQNNIGLGSSNDRIAVCQPTPIANTSHFIEIECTGSKTCGLNDRGELWCWGVLPGRGPPADGIYFATEPILIDTGF